MTIADFKNTPEDEVLKVYESVVEKFVNLDCNMQALTDLLRKEDELTDEQIEAYVCTTMTCFQAALIMSKEGYSQEEAKEAYKVALDNPIFDTDIIPKLIIVTRVVIEKNLEKKTLGIEEETVAKESNPSPIRVLFVLFICFVFLGVAIGDIRYYLQSEPTIISTKSDIDILSDNDYVSVNFNIDLEQAISFRTRLDDKQFYVMPFKNTDHCLLYASTHPIKNREKGEVKAYTGRVISGDVGGYRLFDKRRSVRSYFEGEYGIKIPKNALIIANEPKDLPAFALAAGLLSIVIAFANVRKLLSFKKKE